MFLFIYKSSAYTKVEYTIIRHNENMIRDFKVNYILGINQNNVHLVINIHKNIDVIKHKLIKII